MAASEPKAAHAAPAAPAPAAPAVPTRAAHAAAASSAPSPAPAGQAWDADAYSRNARFVAELGEPLIDLLAPRPGERVLDLGCGDGHLTLKLMARGARVLGVDSSRSLLDVARRNGVVSVVMDGRRLDFERCFDAVFSNAALHWMKRDPDAVIAGVWRALRPGGRFVAEMGGHGCVARIRAALMSALARRGHDATAHDPWFFPTAEDYAARLEARGFRVESMVLFPRPTPLPGSVLGWLETFANPFLAPLPEAERADFLEEARDELRADLCDGDGKWTADYTRLRFKAVRPE